MWAPSYVPVQPIEWLSFDLVPSPAPVSWGQSRRSVSWMQYPGSSCHSEGSYKLERPQTDFPPKPLPVPFIHEQSQIPSLTGRLLPWHLPIHCPHPQSPLYATQVTVRCLTCSFRDLSHLWNYKVWTIWVTPMSPGHLRVPSTNLFNK